MILGLPVRNNCGPTALVLWIFLTSHNSRFRFLDPHNQTAPQLVFLRLTALLSCFSSLLFSRKSSSIIAASLCVVHRWPAASQPSILFYSWACVIDRVLRPISTLPASILVPISCQNSVVSARSRFLALYPLLHRNVLVLYQILWLKTFIFLTYKPRAITSWKYHNRCGDGTQSINLLFLLSRDIKTYIPYHSRWTSTYNPPVRAPSPLLSFYSSPSKE
ncbi:hypothetical protein BJX70DRAFT_324804 [Aspergillus crustosus]